MGTDTGIQWTDHTWNPWHGCTKVSAGCKFCYMYRDKERYGQDPTKVVRSSTTFRAPLNHTAAHSLPRGSHACARGGSCSATTSRCAGGSGTTLVAARAEGRGCIGSERDPATYEIASRRLAAPHARELFTRESA
jgi:hypothetical protein